MDIKKFNKMTVIDLTAICRPHMMLTRLDRQTRASLYAAIQKQHTLVQEVIDVGVEMAIRDGIVKHGKARKRKVAENGHGQCKRRRLYKEKSAIVKENGGFFLLGFFLLISSFLCCFKNVWEKEWCWMFWSR
jgi:hypothetical protein